MLTLSFPRRILLTVLLISTTSSIRASSVSNDEFTIGLDGEVVIKEEAGRISKVSAKINTANAKGIPAAALEEPPDDYDPLIEYMKKNPKIFDPETDYPIPLSQVDTSICEDRDDECDVFMKQGECAENPQYMFYYCPKACDLCGKGDIDILIDAAILKRDNTAGVVVAATTDTVTHDDNDDEIRVTGEIPEQPLPPQGTNKQQRNQKVKPKDEEESNDPFGLENGDDHDKDKAGDDKSEIIENNNHENINNVLPFVSNDKYPGCQDLHIDCSRWEAVGECDTIEGNPEYMFPTCPRSCKLCGKGDINAIVRRAKRARAGDLVAAGWGVEQKIPKKQEKEMKILLDDVKRYMLEEVNVEEKYKSFKMKCQNRHTECTFWALSGEVSPMKLAECNIWYFYFSLTATWLVRRKS